MKNAEETKTYFETIRACEEAREWAEGKTAKEAWDECHRGDWLLWWARKENVDKRVLTLAKGRCAETVIHLMKDQRSKDAVNAAIDYGNGLIDDGQLDAAADAAADAAYAADAAADAAYAADAAAYDAAAYDAADAAAAYDAADAAAAAAADAAYAADAAAADAAAADAAAAYDAAAYDAADAAAADAAAAARKKAREDNQKRTADIVREIINPDFL